MLRFGGLLVLLALALGASAQTRDRTLTVQPSGKPTELRHALVIGNSNYTTAPLKNPVNDARAMAKALGAAGFNVRVVEDATHIGMQRAVRQWGDDIAKGGVGLFYYAGHGLQVKGKNYLVPVNADIDREDEIDFSTLDVNFVLAKMDSAKNALNIVILDACRNNPFARSFRSTSRGLAQMDAPTGTFIAFATAPGSVASDGTGVNGLYTEYLLREMQKPGMPIEQMFKQVRIGVMKETKDQQIPWESSSMRGDFSFRPGAPVAAAAPASTAVSEAAVASAVSAALKQEREAQAAAMEKMIAAALEKQRAMLEAQGLKMQAQQAPPKPAGPDPREKELKAQAERLAAEKAAAEKALAEAKALAQKAAEEKAAAQKAAAALAAAEKAAAERAAAAKAASEKAAAEQAAARLATERAAAERLASQKAAAELNAAADRATAERSAAEKERLQIASAAPVSIASSGMGRMPRQGDTWTYRLNEPDRRDGPKQRSYVATVLAVSDAGVLETYRLDGAAEAQWAHGPGAFLLNSGASIFSPYLTAFQELAPKMPLGDVAINEPACTGTYACEAKARIVSEETVKVAAGTFKAIKVAVAHEWRPGANAPRSGIQTQMFGSRTLTVWYVPEIKRAVKYQSKLNVGSYPPTEPNFELELVSYQLK